MDLSGIENITSYSNIDILRLILQTFQHFILSFVYMCSFLNIIMTHEMCKSAQADLPVQSRERQV